MQKATGVRVATGSWNIGACWNRWDPHIHTPGTLQNDVFNGDWDRYFKAIEEAQPPVRALGITDYCVLDSYLEFRKRQRQNSRASGVAFVFPNIEFRMTVETDKGKGINLHLLFSPEDPTHEKQIERVLASLEFENKDRKYRCTRSELIELGKSRDPKQSDERGALKKGAEQFKLELSQLKKLFKDDQWMRQNCLVGISTNHADGTAGIGRDGAFQALREEIESFAHVMFSPRQSDRDFWLGKKDGFNREKIEETYRSLKPCLHGSDAHKIDDVLNPSDHRYCWIRSELTFSGLKQTLLEPEMRVHIGVAPPTGASSTESIKTLRVQNSDWLSNSEIELNDGLVAIIGPKGNGKTALADMIACAAGAPIYDDASFLIKAQEALGIATAELEWRNDDKTPPQKLAEAGYNFEPSVYVRYLSQRFVDRLCSTEGIHDELVSEIENVVFQSIDETDRLGASNFKELRELKLAQVHRARSAHVSEIVNCTNKIADEEKKTQDLPAKRKLLLECSNERSRLEFEMKSLIPSDKTKEADELAIINEEIRRRNESVQAIKLSFQQLTDIETEFEQFKRETAQRFGTFKSNFPTHILNEAEWLSLEPTFQTHSQSFWENPRARAQKKLDALNEPTSKDHKDFSTWALKDLNDRASSLTKTLGIEQNRIKRHQLVSTRLTSTLQRLTNLTAVVQDHADAETRRQAAMSNRRDAYAAVFGTFKREEEILGELYAPLRQHLATQANQEQSLEFYVRRNVSLDTWIAEGENLLDLRRSGSFQGAGKLAASSQELAKAWRRGDKEEVAQAMETFLRSHGRDILVQRAQDVSFGELGSWLFSTAHVSLDYGIRYNGVDISYLSPGTRGIVLLMLYLAVDRWDTRPLIVDQPEENLDPQSVYDQLVPYFRNAKTRRQIILVTHNPNLVVNADADQVIVANAERKDGQVLPTISYNSGGLENKLTRESVCKILEGGRRAFLEREARYDLSAN